MNKFKLLVSALGCFLALGTVASCEPTASSSSLAACSSLTNSNQLVATPITDALAFPYESDYKTKDFAAPTSGLAYGKVTMAKNGVTDGDTAGFTSMGGTYFKCRFLGINTPESTAKVEPWGVKASAWAKNTLGEAVDFCLVNDIDTYNRLDSAGSRMLGFVWYKTAAGVWRLYNLECVEQNYTKNLLFTDSPKLNYMASFTAAGTAATACGFRVNGTADPDCPLVEETMNVSVYYVRHHFAEIGIDYSTASSGAFLHVTGLVVGMVGDSLVVRDIYRDQAQGENDPLECMYAYAGYNSALASKTKVGYVVIFYCRASKFPTGTDNIQLTDVKTDTSSSAEYRFLSYGPKNVHYTEYVGNNVYGYDYDPVDCASLTPASSADLAPYFGLYIKVRIKIHNVTGTVKDDDGNVTTVDSYFKKTYNSTTGLLTATTIYANVNGSDVPCNLRIDATCSPALSDADFAVDEVWEMKAYLASYYENFQLTVFSNESTFQYAVKIS